MQLQQQTVQLAAIPDGPAGTRATLRAMRQFVKAGKEDYRLRQLALSLVGPLPAKDWWSEIQTLHAFVRDRIRYVRDIKGIETLATPDETLRIGQGDCDDKSVLLATLLETLGHPARFVAVALQPGQYSHVLVETKLGKNWIPLETTENVPAGWYPAGVRARMVEHI